MLIPTRPQATEATPPVQERLTLEEYFRLPEGPPYHEFENGELIVMDQPHGRHQKLILRLGAALLDHIDAGRLGTLWPAIDVHLPGEGRVYAPDLVYLAVEHWERYAEADGRIHGAPDLVVEVLSPSTERRDRTTKMRVYQRAGVNWYWLIWPDDLWLEEYRLTAEGCVLAQSIPPGEAFAPGLFPGLSLSLAALMGDEAQSGTLGE